MVVIQSLRDDQIQERLEKYTKFEEDWDGYGAHPIQQQTVERTLEIIKEIRIRPSWTAPASDGSILLSWDYQVNDKTLYDIELYVEEDVSEQDWGIVWSDDAVYNIDLETLEQLKAFMVDPYPRVKRMKNGYGR